MIKTTLLTMDRIYSKSASKLWLSLLVSLTGNSLLYADCPPLWPLEGSTPLTEQQFQLTRETANTLYEIPQDALDSYWENQITDVPSYNPYLVAEEDSEDAPSYNPDVVAEEDPEIHAIEPPKAAIGLISSRGAVRRNASDVAADDKGIASAISEEPDAADEALQPTELLDEIKPIAPKPAIPQAFSKSHRSCALRGGLCAADSGADDIQSLCQEASCLHADEGPSIPSAHPRSHRSCTLAGSATLQPIATQSSPASYGKAQEAIPIPQQFEETLFTELAPEPEPPQAPEPDPKPIAVAPPASAVVSSPVAEPVKPPRSRSVDASQRYVKATAQVSPNQEVPQEIVPAPKPAEEPIQEPPASRYPLYETDPQSFVAEEMPDAQIAQKIEPQKDLPKAEAPAIPQEGYIVDYQNVPMTEYIKFVGRLTGKGFIYNDDDLQFSVTIVSKEPTSLDNIMAALLQELRIHGLALLEQGNNLIVYKQSGAVSPAALLKEGAHPQEIGTRVFRMQNVPAEKVSQVISKMLSDQALVQVLGDTNTLIVTDLANNVERIGELLRVLDVPTDHFVIGQYAAINSVITDLIPLAEKILDPLSGGKPPLLVPNSSTNSVFIVGSTELVQQSLGVLARLDGREGATEILTINDLAKGGKAIPQIEGATTKSIEEQRREALREEAARRGAQGGGRGEFRPGAMSAARQTKFYIYKLEYRKGDQLQDALHHIADSLRLNERANQDLITAINGVQWIESSNSLIITGTHDAVGRVRELIEALDIPLRQIFLEMLIIDTTVTDSLSYSVDIDERFAGPNSGNAEGVNFPASGTNLGPLASTLDGQSSTNTNTVTGITTTTTTPGITASTFPVSVPVLGETAGFSLGIVGRKIFKDGLSFQTIGALVRALHTDETIDIVMSPKILVEDGFPAEVFVGQNIAYQTQVVTNDQGSVLTANVEYRDVGTSLKVTPQIGNGDIVTLLIEEEVSDATSVNTVAGTSTSTGSSASSNLLLVPQTNKNHTSTKVHVPNGYFVILSGQMRDVVDKTRNQMPCLGGVPFIGGFVSSQSNKLQKHNLMIFIRPQIIDVEPEYDELTRRQQNIWKDKNRAKPRWKYEADEALDFLNLPRFNECHDCCWW